MNQWWQSGPTPGSVGNVAQQGSAQTWKNMMFRPPDMGGGDEAPIPGASDGKKRANLPPLETPYPRPQPGELGQFVTWWHYMRRNIPTLKATYPQMAHLLPADMPDILDDWNPSEGTLSYWFQPSELADALRAGDANRVRDFTHKLRMYYQSGLGPMAGST